MNKIPVGNVVEIDGDEAARLIWQVTKKELFEPYLDFSTLKYFDLNVGIRDRTNNIFTVEAAKAFKEAGVCIKCPTLIASWEHAEEYHLKNVYEASVTEIIQSTLGWQIGGFRQAIQVADLTGSSMPTFLGTTTYADEKMLLMEPSHGTISKHYYLHQVKKPLYASPLPSIYTWTRALIFRGNLDRNNDLVAFCKKVEDATQTAIHDNQLTKDLCPLLHAKRTELRPHVDYLFTEDFLGRARRNLETVLFRETIKV